MNDELPEELRQLQSVEGAVTVIAQHTGLPEERVRRIYQLGEPWPLPNPYFENLGHDAQAAGVDTLTYMAAMGPLIDMDLKDKEAMLEAFRDAVERGEMPSSIPPELENPELDAHIEKVVTLSGENEETVRQVWTGIMAWLERIIEFVQRTAQEMKRRETGS